MGTSFWRRTTIDPPVAEFPEGEHVDIVVVGAGFTGLITALIAAARGSSVVVLEAHTVGAGASAGREGPAVHLGATIASIINRNLGFDAKQRRALLGCGAAAAVSASFNAPIAGVLDTCSYSWVDRAD